MLNNLIAITIIVCGIGLLLCAASIVYQAWLRAQEQREEREIQAQLARWKAHKRVWTR